jgi:hypothetical protein
MDPPSSCAVDRGAFFEPRQVRRHAPQIFDEVETIVWTVRCDIEPAGTVDLRARSLLGAPHKSDTSGAGAPFPA